MIKMIILIIQLNLAISDALIDNKSQFYDYLLKIDHLLRRRADEIVKLLEKTERELSADTMRLSGEVIIGGTPTKTILKAAAKLREEHFDVSFQFYSSDAMTFWKSLNTEVLILRFSLNLLIRKNMSIFL